MGSVAEAVREFDESVQVPWRPPLAGAIRPSDPATGLHVLAMPATRRPRAARAARLTVPPAPAVRPVSAVPPVRPVPPQRPATAVRASGGSTASRHSCPRCAGQERARAGLRLTRRARRLLGVLAACLTVLAAVWLGSVVGGGGDDLVLVSDSSVVVQPGNTLWSIAASVAGDRDVRLVVDQIEELNDLPGAALRPGQVLRLP